MVPRKVFSLKEDGDDDGEDDERYDFLNHLELDEAERTAVIEQTHAIGGHLTHVFEERNAPRKENDDDKRPVGANTVLL